MSAIAELNLISERTEPEFPELFQHAPVGFAQCETQGAIIELNPAMRRLVGPESAASPLCLSDLIRSAENERLISEFLEGQRDSFQVVEETGDSGNKTVRWYVWRVPGRGSSLDHVFVLAEEVSASERRLRQAERLESVGRLAGGVAHDFNNLLTGVLLYCDLLMASLEPSDRSRKYAEEIRNAGLQASGLVRQLLAVAKPTNCAPRLLSINEIAEGMRNLLVRLIGEKIDMNFRLDSSLGLVKMDPAQAQQILLNLVLNARDAMPGGGRITVATSDCRLHLLTNTGSDARPIPSPRCALLVVGDNGKGMDAVTRTHLFEPFFTTKGSNGTGLGLVTVQDIVTRHGGIIHVDSEPDQGTRVSVLLPLAPESGACAIGPSSFHSVENETGPLSKDEE